MAQTMVSAVLSAWWFILVVIVPFLASTDVGKEDDEYEQSMNFLKQNMPDGDAGVMSDEVLNETVTYALLTRHNSDLFAGYTKNLPFDIFQNYVLPYATLSEARDNWRKFFYDTLYPLIMNDNKSEWNVSDITLWFVNNQNAMFNLHFDGDSTPLVYSPFEVLSYGYGSCTGYSLFVIAALRALGIAARVVGTPFWVSACTNTTGNHNWIEIFDENGDWSFTDAPGGYLEMNVTWFYPQYTNCQIAGSLNHSIYASSFKKNNQSETYFVMAWDLGATYVPAFDVTKHYQTTDAQ